MGKRIEWIDAWKGTLILLVVIGHVAGGACHASTGCLKDAYALVYKIIYFFHMPAFFWVAGLCWREQKDGFLSFVRKRAVRLVMPYLVFGVFSVLVFSIVDGANGLQSLASDGYYTLLGNGGLGQSLLSLLHGGGWPKGEGFRCNSVLWFLPSMFSVLCVYFWIDRLMESRRWQVMVAILLLLGSFFVGTFHLGGLPWGISTIPRYLPFLILGRWVKIDMDEVKMTWYWSVLLVSCWLFYGGLAWLLPDCGLGYYRYGWFLVFLLMTFCGVVLSLVSAQMSFLSPIGSRLNAIWIRLGSSSLGIMLLHKFIVLGCQLKVPFIRDALKVGEWRSGVAVILIVLVATVTSWGISRLKPVRWIVG